jgi:hypothetical protein
LGQRCRIFLGATYQNGKNIQKWPQNIRNGSKIDQMDIKFTDIFHSLDTAKITQIGIFGLKIHTPSGNPDLGARTGVASIFASTQEFFRIGSEPRLVQYFLSVSKVKKLTPA